MTEHDDDDGEGRRGFPPRPNHDPLFWTHDREQLQKLDRLFAKEEVLVKLAGMKAETLDLLSSLRREEVETLRTLSALDEDERKLVFQGIALTKSLGTAGRFAKWLVLGLIGIFIAFNQLSEQVMKLVHFFQAGAPK